MKPIMFDVDVNLKDLVTPKSCSYLICELFKHLMYQREQIPYTFDRLKYLITKRRELISSPTAEEHGDQGISLQSRLTMERHYSKAEEMYTNLESVFKDIQTELESPTINTIDEVVVIFGSTPLHAQNIFRIPIPTLAFGHKEDIHPSRQHLSSLFQALLSSDEIDNIFRSKLSPTNVFIMLKMKEDVYPKSEKFLKNDRFSLPVRTSLVNFLLKSDDESCECDCNSDAAGVAIYCDTPLRHKNVVGDVIYAQPVTKEEEVELQKVEKVEGESDSVNECCNWFQYDCSIKGYRDSKVDGICVANLWLKYKRPHSLTC